MKILKKRQDGGHKKLIIYFLCFVFIFCNSLRASQILDYETEQLIDLIIDKIKEKNNIKYQIN